MCFWVIKGEELPVCEEMVALFSSSQVELEDV